MHTLVEVPTDRPRPLTKSFSGASEFFTLPAELAESLRLLSRQGNTTLFTVLMAAFKVLLARCTNQTDLVIGTTSAGRNRPELQRLIGFFAAPLVIRTDLSGDPTFLDVMARVRIEVLAAYAHQDLPFAKVVEAAKPGRHTSYTPLFHVMFSTVKSLLPEIQAPEVHMESIPIDPGATDFDLFVNVFDEPAGIRVSFRIQQGPLLTGNNTRPDRYLQGDPVNRRSMHPIPRSPGSKSPRQLAQKAARKPALIVAATFTAEPVEEILSFWMNKLDFDYRIKFGPYNQVFQQLLDPASLIGANKNGVNVILVRLEDWAKSRSEADLGE